MKIFSIRNIIILFAFTIISITAVLYFFLQKDNLTGQIISYFAERDVVISALQIEELTTSSINISKVIIGNKDNLIIKNIDIKYNPIDIAKGIVNSVSIGSLNLHIYRKQEQWNIAGIEDYKDVGQKQENFDILLNKLPRNLTILDSKIKINKSDLITIDKITLDEKKNLSLLNVNLGQEDNIPNLNITANLAAIDKELSANILIEENKPIKNSYNWQFNLSTKLSRDDLIVDINKATIPFEQGFASIEPLSFSTFSKQETPIKIKLNKINLASFLNNMVGDKVSANGYISGTLLLIYKPGQNIIIKPSFAEAAQEGDISIDPSLIPGTGAPLETTRKALQNFKYQTLKVKISSDKNNKQVINLMLVGKNPDIFGNRQVNLNVNLTGDILSLLENNFFSFNNLKDISDLKEN